MKSSVDAESAAIDVERFFNLLERGYCGYGYFSQENSFGAARVGILEELHSRRNWSTRELAKLIRRHLSFVTDCHLKLGDEQFASHQDFWFSQEPVLTKSDGVYYAGTGERRHEIVTIDDRNPQEFIFPSLDASGLPVLALGTLSSEAPEPLRVTTRTGNGVVERAFGLERAEHRERDLFRRFELGGLPVIRIRTFSDHHVEQLDAFLRSADELRGEPCIVVDLRGNGGGSTNWPKDWIHRLTGQEPDMNQVLTELVSRTGLMGQANYQAWLAAGPGSAIREQLEDRQEQYTSRLRAFDQNGGLPYWQAPYVPPRPPIANNTTLVVVVDRAVASSGEGFISYLNDQVENVVLVGENTRGALVFGHVTAHRLPESGLMAFLPIKLNVALDGQFREGVGFFPDYWVPADDALNRAVAAVRAGTIPTVQPLSPDVLGTEFVPESPPRFSRGQIRKFLQIAMIIGLGTVVGFVNRRRGATVFVVVAVGLAVAASVGLGGNLPARVLAYLLAACNGCVAIYKLRHP